MSEEIKDNPNPQEPEVEKLTEAQQKMVNSQIQARLARQKEALTKELTTSLTQEFEQKMEQLRQEFTSKPENKGEGEIKDLSEKEQAYRAQQKALLEQEQLKTKKAEGQFTELKKQFEELTGQYKSTLKRQAMRDSMQGLGFHTPGDIEKLTSEQIVFDEGLNTYVVKENGITKENAKLEPMTLREFYQDYAAKNPWHVNSDAVGGVGSTPGGSKTAVTKKSDLKTMKDKSDFIEKHTLDAYLALPD